MYELGKEIKWEEIGISNDFLFGRVMQNPKLCKKLLETILGIEIERIEYPEGQKVINLEKDAKSVRLDIFVKDEKQSVYDIEIQACSNTEIPKRSRYYTAMLDLDMLDKGASYKELKHSFVIFICTFDAFDRERYCYTFENMCREEEGLRLDDGTTKIFLNALGTKGDVSPELKAFLEYVAGHKSDDEFVKELDAEVAKVRASKEWRREYMTLLMRDRENVEKGIAQGIEQGELRQIISMVYKKMKKGKTLEVISDELEEDLQLVRKIYDAIILEGEEYDCGRIYNMIFGDVDRSGYAG